MIDFVTWPPLQINNDGTKRWPSNKVNHIYDFLALVDIKHFGHL